MKLLCDVMLIGLGKWLRAAGYDTLIAAETDTDKDLVAQALSKKRILLTRDRKLMEIRYADQVTLLLSCNSIEECIAEISRLKIINWLYKPFSRCLNCNTSLQLAKPEQFARVPDKTRTHIQTLLYCKHCNKLYWHGSHVKHMTTRLQQWQVKYNNETLKSGNQEFIDGA